MASTSACCVMSSRVGGTSVVSHGVSTRAQVERTAPAYNVLLSSRRVSVSGVLVPLVRSGSFSTGRRADSRRSLTIVAAKATQEPETTVNEASAALDDVLKSVQETWEKTDDKLAISGLGFAGLLVLWASIGLVGAIDKLPLVPAFFEFVGILFSGWFVYRYLLFKPDREELVQLIDDAKAKITGQEELVQLIDDAKAKITGQ